jgi:hypothetical protein
MANGKLRSDGVEVTKKHEAKHTHSKICLLSNCTVDAKLLTFVGINMVYFNKNNTLNEFLRLYYTSASLKRVSINIS